MANVSSSNGLEKRPKLRFPGFDEPYVLHRIGDIYAERSERGAADMELLSVTMNGGVMQRSEIEGKDNSSEDKSNYKVVRKGDMVYNSMRMWQGANGVSSYDGIVSPAYTVLTAKVSICNEYFAALFKNYKLINEFRKNSQGMTSDTWNLKYPQIETIKVYLPEVAEQEKVASMLVTLDKRIAAQATLVEQLKKYKRGLLSAIFERRIRFKDDDGSKFPEWEQKKLISCCNGFDNLRQPITANLRRKGKYPYYGANGIQDYVDDYIFDGEYILLAEDGGHFDEFASKPIAQFISGRVWVNNHAHIIQAKQGYNNKYIFYCLEHKDIRKYINGSSRAKLNQEDMWDIPIPVPCLYEQEKIADFITAIDCSINDNVRQLETLQDLKTSLLQQLFI